MTQRSVALFGCSPFLMKHVAALLRESGFGVDLLGAVLPDPGSGQSLEAYDLIIIDAAAAPGLDDSFFSILLSARGFLIAYDDDVSASFPPGTMDIQSTMSPEEIMKRVNNGVFRSSGVRKCPRIDVSVPVEYEFGGRRYQSTIQNLSENGAFVVTLSPLPVRALLAMAFRLSPEERLIRPAGRVLYSIGYNLERGIISHPSSAEKKIVAIPGMGIFFEAMQDSDRETIRQYIDRSQREG